MPIVGIPYELGVAIISRDDDKSSLRSSVVNIVVVTNDLLCRAITGSLLGGYTWLRKLFVREELQLLKGWGDVAKKLSAICLATCSVRGAGSTTWITPESSSRAKSRQFLK